MATTLDSAAIKAHGWRQGSVLGTNLFIAARAQAPPAVTVDDGDWLVVASHDCDVVNDQLEKEPSVEVILAKPVAKPNKQQVGGRNPRMLHLEVRDDAGACVPLGINVHHRWSIPRQLLVNEAPRQFIGDKARRLVAEWLAKRYIRAAFPTAFDRRWRGKLRDWNRLLEQHSALIQGVYLRLNTQTELSDSERYEVDLVVAAPKSAQDNSAWVARREQIAQEVESFWSQFEGIDFIEVDVLCTDQLTLAELELYQRFDADWVSFADDTSSAPLLP